MATTTPNFGWVVPTSTDLVKNGATAIETLGDSIDASMAELKGGTTGQVLSKTSNTDMDFTWVAQDDSNAIQNAIVDAKGDLIGATAADTPARLAVGTNGQVLTADSTAATGLKWAAVAAPAFNGAQVKKTSAQTTTAGGVTTITFDAENYDTNGYHDNSTNNSRLTVPTTGYYSIIINTGQANYPVGVNEFSQVRLYKNGSQTQAALTQYSVPFNTAATAGDYFEFVYYNDYTQSLNGTFSIQFLGA